MKILKNIVSKSPKIALILAILLAISYSKGSLFQSPVADAAYTVADGYAGPVPVNLTVENGVVEGVTLGVNAETQSFADYIVEQGLLSKWNGMSLDSASRYAPDAVSGATYTSRAVIANVRSQAAFLANQQLQQASNQFTSQWIWAQIAVLAVVIFALASYIFPKQFKKYRLVLLLASIGVLGVWQGALISVQLLLGWALNGAGWMQFSLIFVAVLAFGLPLLFSKSFYCTYLCPFGALQELAGKVPVAKIKISVNVVKWFRYVKQTILVAFVVLIFLVPSFEPAAWEPFTVFMINSAAVTTIIIASVSVLGSVFIPKVWCRLLCPTGEILMLVQRNGKFFKR